MFHLLVSYTGWSKAENQNARSGVPADRVLETAYTRPEILQRLRPNNVLNVDLALEHPVAILASETEGKGSQNAIVCRLKSVIPNADGSVTFDWDPIPGVPPIPNAKLQQLSAQLDLDPFPGNWGEMQRTHWAVKNVDLFAVLYLERLRQPESFLKFSDTVDPNLVAVMMPFDVGFAPVYDAIKAAVTALGLRCERADTIWENHKVMDDITHLLSTAAVVVCDFSKQNSNVFYETGIAHTLGKKFIPITQSASDVPFDLREHKYVQYYPNAEGLMALTASLQPRLSKLTKQAA